MDYDQISNLTTDTNDEMIAAVSRRLLIQEIVFTIFFLIGICADLAIIYTIFRFKRLRVVSNIFIANWAITDLCSLSVTPSSYRIVSVITSVALPHSFLCVLEEFGIILHASVQLSVILVLVHWFISAYFENTAEKINKTYKAVIAALWIFSICSATITSALCMSNKHVYIHQPLLLFGSYFIVFLLVTVCQCARAIQKYKGKPLLYPTLSLNLATVFAIVTILSIFSLLFLPFVYRHIIFEIMMTCLLFSGSIFSLALLYFLDADFQACLHQAFKRSSNYEDTTCTYDNPLLNNDEEETVKISFTDSDEKLNE